MANFLSEFLFKLKAQSPFGLAQAVLYFLSVIFAFFVAVPVGIVLVSAK